MTTMRWRASLWPLLLLTGLAVAVRFPFFFPAVIDHDESTFLLIGQSWWNGFLPYTQVWDVKPPLVFGVFAGIIAVAGDSLVGIRLAGALCVSLTAWWVYLIGRRTWTIGAAAVSAAACVVLSSVLASGQATMSEHVMLPLLMAAMVLWLRPELSSRAVFAIGGLLAAATLIRPNVGVTLLLLLALLARRRTGRAPAADVGLCLAGAALVTAAVALPFVAAGRGVELWNTAVVAAGVRAGVEGHPGDHLRAVLLSAVTTEHTGAVFWPVATLWVLAGAAVVRASRLVPASRDLHVVRQLAIVLTSVIVGIVVSGGTYQHYWIQAVPFVALLATSLLAERSRLSRLATHAAFVCALVLALPPIVGEYRGLIRRVAAGESLSHGAAYDIAAFLRRENPEQQPVVLLTDHLAYWLVGTLPPSRFAAHPSTLGRRQVLAVMGTTPEAEVTAMFSRSPMFVVLDESEVLEDAEAVAVLQQYLARDYVRQPSVGGRTLYRRAPMATAPRP